MENRNNKQNASAVISKIFDEAGKKIKNNENKEVLYNLRSLLAVVEEDLLDVKP